MKAKFLHRALCLTVAATTVNVNLPVVYAQQEEVKNETIQVIKGDVYSYEASNVTRVSVTDPAVADISDAQKDTVLILGKTSGQTILFVWDDNGKHAINVTVVNEDLNLVKKRVDSLLEKAGISSIETEVDGLEGKVVISGNVSKETKATAERIIEPFNQSILNLLKEETSQELIQIEMQIVEVSTSISKNLGIEWGSATDEGGPLPAAAYRETLPNLDGSKDWFKIGSFNRTAALANTINFLIQEGKAKDLSRPRILVTSGKEATINVGGEIPTTSTSVNAAGNTAQTNITFKQYGVTLTVTPTIKDGKIDILMNTQVSDIDKSFYTTNTTDGGTNTIAYKTRTAQTQLMLDDRQTVVFAGLIRYSESEQTKRLPLLGKVPIVGILFRNKSNPSPNEGKELVITLTPTIMRSKEYVKDQIKLPSKKLVEYENQVLKDGKFEKEMLPEIPAKEVKPVVSAEMNENMVTTNYVRGIQEKIAKSISYPEEAVENNITGTVKLKITVRKDGFLSNASIEESSGQKIFDEDALNTAKSLVPYAKFPSALTQEELTVTIPIVYSQTTK